MNHALTCLVHRTPTELTTLDNLIKTKMHASLSLILEGDPRLEIVESFLFCFSFPGKQTCTYSDFRHIQYYLSICTFTEHNENQSFIYIFLPISRKTKLKANYRKMKIIIIRHTRMFKRINYYILL